MLSDLSKPQQREVKKIISSAEKLGISVIVRRNGHMQLKGKLLVNYYPFSKDKSAYVAGTTSKANGVNYKKALLMCNEAPTVQSRKDKRSGSSKKIRAAIFKKVKSCHWCNKPLTVDDSTLEHIIPLSRGGLDHSNNRTLACYECNHGRADDMPELKIT